MNHAMKWTSRPIATCLAATLAALQPASAMAADEAVQKWAVVTLKTSLDTQTTASLTGNVRFRSDGTIGKALFLTLDHALTDWVSVGGGIGRLGSPETEELRPYQQLTLNYGDLALRSRLEERMFDGAPHTELRLRERVEFTPRIARDTSAKLSVEWLHILRPRDPDESSQTNHCRFSTEISHRFDDKVRAGIGYMVMLLPHANTPDKIIHVPQVTATISL